MFKRILVASDLSEHAMPALRTALELGRKFAAPVHALHVIAPMTEPTPWLSTFSGPELEVMQIVWEREEVARLEALRRQLKDAAPPDAPALAAEPIVRRGLPAETIVEEAAARHADLLVVGTHGRSGLKHAILGSVAERIVRKAPCAVLVAR